MDRKNVVIIILGIALVIALVGFFGASVRATKTNKEKDRIMQKIKQTESLTTELSRNVADLKAMLTKVEKEKSQLEKEKERLAMEARDMKEMLKTIPR